MITPATLKLLPGKYNLKINLSGLQEWTSNVTVTANAITEVNATLIPIPSGKSELSVSLDPGKYTINLEKAGFKKITDIIEIVAGEMVSRSYIFVPNEPSVLTAIELSGCDSIKTLGRCTISAKCIDQYSQIMENIPLMWSSSNIHVATVDSGQVYGRKSGTVTIIATHNTIIDKKTVRII